MSALTWSMVDQTFGAARGAAESSKSPPPPRSASSAADIVRPRMAAAKITWYGRLGLAVRRCRASTAPATIAVLSAIVVLTAGTVTCGAVRHAKHGASTATSSHRSPRLAPPRLMRDPRRLRCGQLANASIARTDRAYVSMGMCSACRDCSLFGTKGAESAMPSTSSAFVICDRIHQRCRRHHLALRALLPCSR